MVFKNGVKNIQAAAYNGARTVFKIAKNCKRLQLVILLNFCITDPPLPPQIHGDLPPEQNGR
jgi:hypothetical protein